MNYRSYFLAATAYLTLLTIPTLAVAQLTITTDTVQNGGTLTVSPSGNLRVIHSSQPELTLTNGATSSGVQDVYLYDGKLQVTGSSVLENQSTYIGWSDSTGLATVSGPGSRWDMSSSLFVGDLGGQGELNITNGGLVTSTSTSGIGGSSSRGDDGGSGVVNITGSGSRWELSNSAEGYLGFVEIGQSAQGELNILDGATVSVAAGAQLGTVDLQGTPGGSGTATVSGAGSRWDIGNDQQGGSLGGSLDIGVEGEGIVNITNGAVVNHTGRFFNGGVYLGGSDSPISYGSSGGSGTLTISGPGSQLNSNSVLYVGFDGSGMLNINNSGVANVRGVDIGYRAGSTGSVTVSGAGSILDASDVRVGRQGDGTLTINQGGLVKASSLSITGDVGGISGIGEVLVTGAGSRLELESMFLRDGQATLTIADGGIVAVSGQVEHHGFEGNAPGAISVDGTGSKLDAGGVLSLSEYATSSLSVTNGGQVNVGGINASKDQLQGNGTINANGAVLGGYDLVFDSNSGLQQTLPFGTGGTLKINLDGTGNLGAGYAGVAGSLMIRDGLVANSQYGHVGHFDDLQPTPQRSVATITGIGTEWNAVRQLSVFENGELNILNGAVVTSSQTEIWNGSEAIVSGAGSKWVVAPTSLPANSFNGRLAVHGQLRVDDGAEVITNTIKADISNLFGNGTIYAKGAVLEGYDLIFDSTHGLQQTISFGNGGQLHLDLDGTGALGAGENGTLTIADGVKIVSSQASLNSTGAVTITGAGSTWEISGSLSVGGSLKVQDGAMVSVNGSTYIGYYGNISGDGGTLLGDVFNDGTIAPGNSPGTLDIDGDLEDYGVLQFEIASLSDFDHLNIAGELSAGGIVEISLLDNFIPAPGSVFDLIDFESFIDTGYAFDFSSADLANANWSWDTSDFATNGTVSVIAIPEPSTVMLALLLTVGLRFVVPVRTQLLSGADSRR